MTYDAAFDADEALASTRRGDRRLRPHPRGRRATCASARTPRAARCSRTRRSKRASPTTSTTAPRTRTRTGPTAASRPAPATPATPTAAARSRRPTSTATRATPRGLDYWVVNEHNHLIQDAIATNNPPVTEAKVRQRYQDGLAAANTATVNGSFVAHVRHGVGRLHERRPGPRDADRDAEALRLGNLHDLQRPDRRVHARHELLLRRLHAEALRLSRALRRARSRIPPAPARWASSIIPASGEFDNFAFNAERRQRHAGHRRAQRPRLLHRHRLRDDERRRDRLLAALEGSAQPRLPPRARWPITTRTATTTAWPCRRARSTSRRR